MNDTQNTAPSQQNILRDLGNRLHEARAMKRISQEEVAATLKLSLSQVKGLETGDWSFLPDGIYALGFLRQYANMLGVDVSAEIYQLKTKLSLKQPVTISDPAIAPSRRWAIFSLLLFVALAVYFNMEQNNDQPSTSIETTKLIPLPATTAAKPFAQKEDIAVAPPTLTHGITTPAIIEPYSNQENKVVVPTPTANDAGVIHHLLLSAMGGDVWLSLSTVPSEGKETTKLKEMLLRDGQTASIDTTEEHLLLTAGNAIALSISIDDMIRYPAGTLGMDGKVLRKLWLTLSSTGR